MKTNTNSCVRQHLYLSATLVALLLLGVSTRAAVTPIGPFTGSLSETWESFNDYLTGPRFLADPTSIMGGGAIISSSRMSVYLTNSASSFGLGSSGHAKVADGAKGMGLGGFAQTATITFANPVVDFGAYWGAATPPWGPESPPVEPTPTTVSLAFSDGSFDSFTYFAPDHSGTLEWHGWHFATGITSISYSGGFVVVDGLQANAIADADGDGVPDSQDQCPNTPAGAVVDAHGCTIDQLVPCAGPSSAGTWKNHGQYVSAVAQTAEAFLAASLITEAEKDLIVKAAAQSDCGRKP
jgi:hypothetical protein